MLIPASAEVEVSQFLTAVGDGAVFLASEQEPRMFMPGKVRIASNGWRIVIYNDANEGD
jgi:hypothetical protein